jgi:hypothetical protein
VNLNVPMAYSLSENVTTHDLLMYKGKHINKVPMACSLSENVTAHDLLM